mmetsp:Transcript_2789/g.5936  ORF Transcript_2789/g.5936 Transcript_2789/m.5936 type:complete len:207 (+) Transcript_2789:25-645(+)
MMSLLSTMMIALSILIVMKSNGRKQRMYLVLERLQNVVGFLLERFNDDGIMTTGIIRVECRRLMEDIVVILVVVGGAGTSSCTINKVVVEIVPIMFGSLQIGRLGWWHSYQFWRCCDLLIGGRGQCNKCRIERFAFVVNNAGDPMFFYFLRLNGSQCLSWRWRLCLILRLLWRLLQLISFLRLLSNDTVILAIAIAIICFQLGARL